MVDMHIHSRCSEDSEAPMDSYAARADILGIDSICFTDHLDCNPHGYGYRYFVPEDYWREFNAASELNGRVQLLSGLEFGDPQMFPVEFNELNAQPFDFILGSVHFTERYPDLFFSELIKTGVTAVECYDTYWATVLECVSFGGFDCLGHLDFPKRYYNELIYDEAKLRAIFHVMHENGIILEINASTLLRLGATMPCRELLQLYSAEGGRYAVFGSDAHRVEDLGVGYAESKALLDECGITEVMFVKRKMIVL